MLHSLRTGKHQTNHTAESWWIDRCFLPPFNMLKVVERNKASVALFRSKTVSIWIFITTLRKVCYTVQNCLTAAAVKHKLEGDWASALLNDRLMAWLKKDVLNMMRMSYIVLNLSQIIPVSGFYRPKHRSFRQILLSISSVEQRYIPLWRALDVTRMKIHWFQFYSISGDGDTRLKFVFNTCCSTDVEQFWTCPVKW